MTVKELKTKLEQADKDAKVIVVMPTSDNDNGFVHATSTEYNTNSQLGDDLVFQIKADGILASD